MGYVGDVVGCFGDGVGDLVEVDEVVLEEQQEHDVDVDIFSMSRVLVHNQIFFCNGPRVTWRFLQEPK